MGAYQITDRCIGCTLCAKNCPVGAITGTLKQPHSIDPAKCIGCGVCGKVCNPGAVLDDIGRPAPKVPKTEWKRPIVDTERCVGCSVCVENCPKECLVISRPRFHGDIRTVANLDEPNKCIACGLCAKACPIDAIKMVAPGDGTNEEVLAYIKKEGKFMWSLKLAWYKIFQFFFTKAQYFLPWHQSKVISGAGSVKQLPKTIKADKVTKVLVVTDAVLMGLGMLDGLFEAMKEEGIEYVVYDKVQPNPTIDSIEEARAMYLAEKCNGIVAFGGGSSMDCAKAAGARVVKPNQSVQQMGGVLRVLRKLPPFYAIPTTAGTGSETTIASVVTDPVTHHKYAINDLCLIPKYAVLDPELTVGLPPHITSTTGMDALTHAVEAYTNRYAPKYTDDFAVKAVKLIFENLEVCYKDGQNLEARNNMLLASYYGGAAFTRACVGNVHAIAHTLGGLYGVPHGLANSVILPIVMEDFGPAVYYKLARLAEVVGIEGENDAAKAKAFIVEIRRMNKDMNIQDTFDMIRDEDIPQMIEWAMAEANPVYPVPVIWGRKEFAYTIDRIRGKIK